MRNLDSTTVEGFGNEWTKFDQSMLPEAELQELFDLYFGIFPWAALPAEPVGFDLGCGSGRWASLVADKVATLHCIDASEQALKVARRNLAEKTNCVFHLASVERIPLEDGTMDFGYSLGVLHHVPDTFAGIESCVRKLKPGAPLLLYLYYAFDNRPLWYRLIWKTSDIVRRIISGAPWSARLALSQAIAAVVYLPLARIAKWLEAKGKRVGHLPLANYRHRSFYTMRTDALDRFGTRLEQRFTSVEIRGMMERAGLEQVVFSDSAFWCAIGYKKAPSSGPR